MVTIIKNVAILASLGVFICVCVITSKLDNSCDSLNDVSSAFVYTYWAIFGLVFLIIMFILIFKCNLRVKQNK